VFSINKVNFMCSGYEVNVFSINKVNLCVVSMRSMCVVEMGLILCVVAVRLILCVVRSELICVHRTIT